MPVQSVGSDCITAAVLTATTNNKTEAGQLLNNIGKSMKIDLQGTVVDPLLRAMSRINKMRAVCRPAL